MNDQTIHHIDVKMILTPVQVRPIDHAHVAKLAESIKRHGQEVPVVLHETGTPGVYDLGPGRHRLEALKALKFPTAMAIIKPPASSDELRAEQVRENLDRKDMTPLEEARACAEYLKGSMSAEDVASILGRSAKWVELRAALLRLHPKVLEMIDAGTLPIGHAQLIARVADQAEQLDIAQRARAETSGGGTYLRSGQKRTDVGQPMPVWEVRRMVDACGRSLSTVGWRMDAVFGKHGACAACPHNSANRGDLFASAEAPKAATCLESSCHAEKSVLTGRSVRKAAFHLVREKLPRTTAGATQAAAAREVTFVSPAAVLEAAKRVAAEKRRKPEGGKKDVKADKHDPFKPRERTAKEKLTDARSSWREDVEDAITKALLKKPLAAALLTLVDLSEAYPQSWQTRKGDPKKQQAVRSIIDKLPDVSGAGLLELAKLAGSVMSRDMPNLPDDVLTLVATKLDVTFKAMPTLEEIQAGIDKAKAKEAKVAKAAPAKKAKGKGKRA